jgi:carbonic anhydrase
MIKKSLCLSRLMKLSLALLFVFFIFANPAFANDETSADEALMMLIRGNERFVSGKVNMKDFLRDRPKLADGRKPYAIILACADSRVPPELVFDESLGRIFVIRVAGNVVDPAILGSIEYAVEHFRVPLLFVLGHESCGAVKAKLSGGKFPPNIASLLSRISPAVNKVRTLDLDEKSSLAMSVKENVGYQMQMSVYESEILREAVREHHLKIVGGVYDLDTGKVEIVSNEVTLQSFDEKEVTEESESNKEKEKSATEPVQKKSELKTFKLEKKEPTEKNSDKKEKTESSPKETPGRFEASPSNPKPSALPVIKGERIAQTESNSTTYQNISDLNRPKSFQEFLRSAFENKSDVMVKSSLLMRDEQDRCVTSDCRYLPAGETVKIISPALLNINNKPFIRVRYKGQSFYIQANAKDLEFLLK